MKRLIPTLVLFMLVCHVHGQVERDKVLHFVGGNLYGLAGAGIAKQISDGNRYWTFAGAVGGSLLIGLGKEAVDAGQRENGWDNDDLLATVLGGLSVGFTIDIFPNKKSKKRGAGGLTVEKLNHQELQKAFAEKIPIDISSEDFPSLNSFSIPDSLRKVE